MKQHDAAGLLEKYMSKDQKTVTQKLEDLEREIQELKARLNLESGQRASADAALSSRIHMLSAVPR
ncbi:hypothetical protein [Pseudomonas viridiflava]|uniref:hypothetical protein n=1 Tax=Pseudomonas viridiflava TaxID=33069 RepID=UPI0013CF308C|nr:hypothetical protein [Pseudomonas viridiflava]